MTSCAEAARAGGVERVDSRVYQVSAAVEDALAGSYQLLRVLVPIDTKARFVSHEPTCLLIRAGRGGQGCRVCYFGRSGNKFRIRGRAQDDDCAYLCRCPTGRRQRLADACPRESGGRGSAAEAGAAGVSSLIFIKTDEETPDNRGISVRKLVFL